MKYYIWVLGCAMNYSDAERIATVMDLLGYKKTEIEAEADVIITVACSVRQHAIDRIYGKLKLWQKLKIKNKKLKTILSGCVLPEDKKKMAGSFDLIFEISEMDNLAGFLKNCHPEFISGSQEIPKQVRNDMLEKRDYLSLLPTHESSFRAFVPIMTGCNNFCSYCAVPLTRGREKSRPQEEIINEIKGLIKKGYKEITLLGQNVNSYKPVHSSHERNESRSPHNNFGELLKKLDKIPGEWRGYFYSNHPKDFTEELIQTIADLSHFPHYIHLPLQSGNNEILRSMNRHYNQGQYLELVKKIRKIMPDVVLTTDIIVGYPGEGEAEFLDTVSVVKKAKFEMIFLGKYSPRPGTKSAKLVDDVPAEVKKQRDEYLTKLLGENLEIQNKKLEGQKVRVLIDEKKGDKFYGRTEGYKVVEISPKGSHPVEGETLEVGQFCDVKIERSTAWKLFGSIG